MKILVTGGAGFTGSAVIRHIIKNTSDSVVNVDKLTYADNLESLIQVENSERYAFEQVDICDRNVLDAAKMERESGWKPAETFESDIGKTVEWSLNNREWWITVLDGSYSLNE